MQLHNLKWFLATGSLIALLAAGWYFMSAMATASLRFSVCGASTLDAVDPYCRVGVILLHRSYLLAGAAVVLAVIAFLVYRFSRARPN
jgi:uncharacterized membrane protein